MKEIPDLASVLAREGPVEPERALAIVTQLAEALDTARWSRGLVHGSLNPGTVRVHPASEAEQGERVSLLGLGPGRNLTAGASLADGAEPVGRVDYLAPEQIAGKPAGPASDIYALGRLLFECLTGDPPFRRHKAEAVGKAHVHEQPPSVRQQYPELPARIDAVIAKALAEAPEERYSTCGELAAAAAAAFVPGEDQPERASDAEALSAAVVLPTTEPDDDDQRAPTVTDWDAGAGPGSAPGRIRRHRRSVASAGLIAVLVALLAGAIWLTENDTRDVAPANLAEGEAPEQAPADEEPTSERLAGDDQTTSFLGSDSPEPPADIAEPAPSVSDSRGALVRIDATTGEILARIAIPAARLVAADGGSVWVFGDAGELVRIGGSVWVLGDAGELVRIEAGTNAARSFPPTDAAGLEATGLAAAGRTVWLGDGYGSVYRLAPGADAAERMTLVGFEGGALNPIPEGSLVAAAGSLWVTAFPPGSCCTPPPDLYRVDPATGEVIAGIDNAHKVVASGRGFVWALGGDSAAPDPSGLVRIETDTHATAPVAALEFPWSDLTAAGGSVWASIPVGGMIVRLDPVTGEEKERIRVGREPGALAAGAGAVWAAISNGTVARYDIASDRVETIDVGGTPTDLVFAGDSVWVAVEEAPGGGSPGNSSAASSTEPDESERQALNVDGVRFSFRVPAGGWERFGNISINKSTVGPQGAEAIVFWTRFPDGEHADPCAGLLGPSAGRSATSLAAAVSAAPGTELVAGPSDVTVGGRAAKHVVLTVRDDVGCDPGFFFRWDDFMLGALWPETMAGDTIRVWIVDLGGSLLFIEAETRADLGQEVEQIVESIRFERTVDRLTRPEFLREAYAICQAANVWLDATTVDFSNAGVTLEETELLAFIAENALAELRALPAPKADRTGLEDEFALREQEIDLLREAAAAAAAGDGARTEALQRERLNLTHQRGSLGYLPAPCPVGLSG